MLLSHRLAFLLSGRVCCVLLPTPSCFIADSSRRDRFILSGAYQLPSSKELDGLFRRLRSGWALSRVVTIQSGQALTITNTKGANVFGISEDRAQIAPGCTTSQVKYVKVHQYYEFSSRGIPKHTKEYQNHRSARPLMVYQSPPKSTNIGVSDSGIR